MKPEQLPVAEDRLHGWTHFAEFYAGEHVAATEFVIGATFVALGATTTEILIGLLIGNILAVLSRTFMTAPIAGDSMTSLYNWALPSPEGGSGFAHALASVPEPELERYTIVAADFRTIAMPENPNGH